MSVTRPTDVPRAPGVYEFSDTTGRVLYVGKAKDLAQRIASYFPGDPEDLHPRTRRMLANATAVRWVLCASETEALVLEREWVHAKQPPYNVRLRTGDGYGGISVSRGPVPRLSVWRGRRPANAETFGPYPGTSNRDLLDALMTLFGVRTCDENTYKNAARTGRACLLGETGKCLAPCVGTVDAETHRQAAVALKENLERPDPALAGRLEKEMRTFAEALNFEAAARRRDQLEAFATLGRRQRVAGETTDVDALAVSRSGERIAAALVSVRGGVVTEVEQWAAADDPGLTGTELLETVLALLPERDSTRDLLTGHPVGGTRAPRGDAERAVLAFATTQAEESLVSTSLRRDDPAENAAAAARIAEIVGAGAPVRRIECTDISHTNGRHTVGSVVTFVDGAPRKDLYRRLNLRDLGGDDYAATRMLVSRRLRPGGMGHDALPDLLLVDGGPGQVKAAVEGRGEAAAIATALGDDSNPGSVPIMGLAKRFEELWPEGADVAVRPEPNSALGLLLRHARDEAHRHALGGNRRQRERAAVRTGLDGIRGLGPARRAALLSRFGTLDAVAAAPVEELATVPGVGPSLAARIREAFTGTRVPAPMTPDDAPPQSTP
ncbi:MAG: excinuclease ABC subunit UvrC [Acidobacteria bacterium]|nr:excinuclease ABC subunit UvrC [Acidobacteriota bacterium]